MFKHRADFCCIAIIGVVYVMVYSWLIVAGYGMPYVMDNNESFSSLWHAYNLFNFDFSKSAGLADESFAYHAAAHPYVHTHQGNFPRLFAALIFFLGADSIERQIVVTTFSVGVMAIYMAYHFFSKIANPLFALVCCMLLITDYVLVAQWQVVTYRVWHMFFVFSSMLCVHRMFEGRRFWAPATVINFACLFYYELVFVAFVSLSTAFYAAYLCRRNPEKIPTFWGMQALGGLMALSVLILQLYLYLGWDGVRTDLYLTFVARNDYQDIALLLQHMQEFFEPRNIVFWYNLADGATFRTIGQFFTSFLHFEFQVRTPFLSLLCAIGLLALFVLLRIGHSQAIAGSVPQGNGSRSQITDTAIAVFSFLAIFGVFVTLFGKGLILGAPAEMRQWFLPTDFSGFIILLTAAAGSSVLLHRACRFSGRAAPEAMFTVSVFLLLASLLISMNWLLYDPRYAPLWQEIADQYLPAPLPQLVVILVLMLACAAIVAGKEAFWETGVGPAIKGCGAFLAAGLCAYVVVYLLSPGYVFTGYRFRHVPFTVFHTTVMPALLLYALLAVGLKYLPYPLYGAAGTSTLPEVATAKPKFRKMSMPVLVGIASLSAFGLLTLYWAGLQFSYARLMPPDHYSFLQKLSQPPYVGKSFLVNTYAAPIAAKTGAWAYQDVNLKSTEPVSRDVNYGLLFDATYLWFVDKKTNPDYAQPEYFICVTMQSVSTVLEEVLRRRGLGDGNAGCGRNQLIELARRGKGESVYPALELMEPDRMGPVVVGYERWAIVKLNWNR